MPIDSSFLRATLRVLVACAVPLVSSACCGGDEQCLGTLTWQGETYQVKGKGAYGAIQDGCRQYCAKHDAANKDCARKCTSDASAAQPFPLHADCN